MELVVWREIGMQVLINKLAGQARSFERCALLLIITGLSCGANASVLTDLVASMPEKTWVQMPANSSITGLGLEQTLTTYANSGVWDSANDRMMWMGGPGGCCVSEPIYKMITYDAPTDTWNMQVTPFHNRGHGYDGNAYDPNTGRFYFKSWYEGIKVLNGNSWSSIPDAPWGEEAAPALTYFPAANNGAGALLYVGSLGHLAWFNGSRWIQIDQGQTWGSYHNIAVYNPVHNVVWLGSGSTAGASSNANRVTYKLDAQMNLTRMNDAPFDLQSSSSGAMQMADPNSGKFLIQRRSNDSWWEYDILADRWAQISGMANKPNLEAPFGVTIPELGVIMVFENYTSGAKAYIYKHAPGNLDLVAPASPVSLIVR